MTGIKITSMCAILAATDAINPALSIPYEQFTAMGLSAFCVWQMWKMIQRREERLEEKDSQVNKLISVMEQRPCLHGHIIITPIDKKDKQE